MSYTCCSTKFCSPVPPGSTGKAGEALWALWALRVAPAAAPQATRRGGPEKWSEKWHDVQWCPMAYLKSFHYNCQSMKWSHTWKQVGPKMSQVMNSWNQPKWSETLQLVATCKSMSEKNMIKISCTCDSSCRRRCVAWCCRKVGDSGTQRLTSQALKSGTKPGCPAGFEVCNWFAPNWVKKNMYNVPPKKQGSQGHVEEKQHRRQSSKESAWEDDSNKPKHTHTHTHGHFSNLTGIW